MTAAPPTAPQAVTAADAPAPRVPAGVHLAKRLDDGDKQLLRRETLCSLNADVISELRLALIVAGLIVTQRFLMPMPTRAVLILFAFVLAGVLVSSAWARILARRRPVAIPDLPLVSDPEARVRLVGDPACLAPAYRLLLDVGSRGGSGMSEPELFRITHAHGTAAMRWFRAIVCLAVSAAVLAMMATIAGSSMVVQFLRNPYVTIMIVLAAARAAWGFVWPTTVRITPRRVDVLQYSFLGLGRPRVRSFDLRHARILIDFNYGRVLLRQDDADDGRWLYGVVGGPARGGREMGLAVLAAAYSEFDPPAGLADESGSVAAG